MPSESPAIHVVGAGPNGLAAAIVLAEAGLPVHVVEANRRVGGAARTSELTLPDFWHDLGSSVHPLAVASPFFRDLPLDEHGLEWVEPEAPLAHPLDSGQAVLLHRSIEQTVVDLDRGAGASATDGLAWAGMFSPLVRDWPLLEEDLLGPLIRLPVHPASFARFGALGMRSAKALAKSRFEGVRARALFAGLAAHSALSLDRMATAAFGLVLGILAHRTGWPFPRGGAGHISEALAAHLSSLGGTIETGRRLERLDELTPGAPAILDLTPRQIIGLGRKQLTPGIADALGRYRYGPAAFKVDWALDGPIPWRDPACSRAGTVHLGGTLEEIAASEKEVAAGRCPKRPFVLLAQHSLFDRSRAPRGKHTAWAYCHVPNGSSFDMTARIEEQIARFAPGFRDLILERAVSSPTRLEQMNANLVGGDINGGAQDFAQMLRRPLLRPTPYRLERGRLYICSSSTPPGGGVHGMCGVHAARTFLKDAGRR